MPRPGRGRRRNRPKRSDRKSTRLNSSHGYISYAVFCLKKKKQKKSVSRKQVKTNRIYLHYSVSPVTSPRRVLNLPKVSLHSSTLRTLRCSPLSFYDQIR